MMVIEVSYNTGAGEDLSPECFIAPNIGEALNEYAPDPREGIVFKIRVITKEAKVIHA